MPDHVRPMSFAPRLTQRELVAAALRKLESRADAVTRTEAVALACELTTLRQALLQMAGLADDVLRDDFDPDAMREAIKLARGLALVGR